MASFNLSINLLFPDIPASLAELHCCCDDSADCFVVEYFKMHQTRMHLFKFAYFISIRIHVLAFYSVAVFDAVLFRDLYVIFMTGSSCSIQT